MGPESKAAHDILVKQLISLVTTEGVLERACEESEEVKARVLQIIEGQKPKLQSGESVPAEESPACGYALGKQASHQRHKRHIPGI